MTLPPSRGKEHLIFSLSLLISGVEGLAFSWKCNRLACVNAITLSLVGAGWSVPAMPIIRDNSPKIRQCAQLERKQTQRASYDRVLIVSSACMALCSDITLMSSPKG